MGQVLVQRILSGELGHPRKVIVMSRDEGKQHAMRMSYMHKRATSEDVIFHNFEQVLEFRIGDVRNYEDICSALKSADIAINAAALKQVPTCEYFPYQAVLTNCMGAANIVRAIREQGYPVETVVGVSTDKAVKPVNVMGMSKAIQERILISANILSPETRFICVRYGNVLASRGSVIPLFHDQIVHGGPVTVTVPEMTRFLLSLNQAVNTVFSALKDALPGETFVPIAPSATAMNIAKALVGDRDIEIKVTGIRPGEKMHEVLVSEEECNHTIRRGEYYAIQSMLPEITGEIKKSSVLSKEYCSGDEVLSLEETVDLLKKHDLMPGSQRLAEGGELLV